MRQAKQRRVKPRHPLAALAEMKKGGAHLREDKRASRARKKAELSTQLDDHY